MSPFTLYSYWRSSSSYRVRIALQLKGVDYRLAPVHLLRAGGEQHRPEFRALNPQELVPVLEDGEFRLTQSLAIFQYLEARLPQPKLVPDELHDAARMWAFCQAVACEIQPLQNTRVLHYLEHSLGVDEARRMQWLRHWIGTGLVALEGMIATRTTGAYCFGDRPSYADCCLIPQLYAARRFNVELAQVPRLLAIEARCRELAAFRRAAPEAQPDAPQTSG